MSPATGLGTPTVEASTFSASTTGADVHRQLGQSLTDLVGDALLEPAAQVLGQELLRRGEHRQVVDGVGEAVTLVVGDQVLHREVTLAQRNDDLGPTRPA